MKDKTTKELADRLNAIMIERNKLDLEHNRIVKELHSRMPHLKKDPNLELKKVKK